MTEKTDFGLWWRRISDIVNEARTLQDSQLGDFPVAGHDLYTVVLQDMIGRAHKKELYNTDFLVTKKLEDVQIGSSGGILPNALVEGRVH